MLSIDMGDVLNALFLGGGHRGANSGGGPEGGEEGRGVGGGVHTSKPMPMRIASIGGAAGMPGVGGREVSVCVHACKCDLLFRLPGFGLN